MLDNVVERSFKEVKRRAKPIGRFQDEERGLTMVCWQLKELKWNGVGRRKEACRPRRNQDIEASESCSVSKD